MRLHVVGNPAARAGRGETDRQRVLEALSVRGLDPTDLTGATAADTADALADAVAEGAERVVVVGGDGLVNLAVQAVAQTPTVLGVVASGTGNDFVGALGLPTDLIPAVDAALADPVPVDLIRIGERWGASVATVGFSVAVNERANRMRFPRGASRYTIATLAELRSIESELYEVTIDGVDHDVEASLITVANTSDFGGSMRISPSARPDDGRLELTVVGEVGRLELLAWFRKVFSGTHLDHPAVTTLSGTTVTIAHPDAHVWCDGEPMAPTPVTLAAVPGALLLAGVTLGT